MLVKRSIFKKVKYFDDNIFLYFEESDLYTKCIKANLPVYMYNKVKISNPISKSIDRKYLDEYIVVEIGTIVGRNFIIIKNIMGILLVFLKLYLI